MELYRAIKMEGGTADNALKLHYNIFNFLENIYTWL